MTSTHRHRDRDGAGTAAIFVVCITLALLTAAGLVIDGGYALAARRAATNHAEQAARVGADALDGARLRDGTVVVDPAAAHAAAAAYLARIGATGTVAVSGGTVTVTVTDHQDTAILSAVGVEDISVSATSSARSVAGAAEVTP